MIVVSWGSGHVAAFDDQHRLIDVSSSKAKREIEAVLVAPAIHRLPGEYERVYSPGEPEHFEIALRSLSSVTLTKV